MKPSKVKDKTMLQAADALGVSERRARALREQGKLKAEWSETARRWLCSDEDIDLCAVSIDTSRRQKGDGETASRSTDYRRRRAAGAVRAVGRPKTNNQIGA
jgi:hypothetical protein